MSIARVQRLVLNLLPEAIERLLVAVHRPLARLLAALNFMRKHATALIWRIDSEDDLLHWLLRAETAEPPCRYFRAVQNYFEGGETNVAELEEVLGEAGRGIREAVSVLEFACGYGRLTRHLVRRTSRAKLAVSDIDRRAVDFATRTFSVSGFYSTTEPESLVHDRRYELILVVSLFSHLPTQTWTRWLKRLGQMLTPDGVLVFSTLLWDTSGGTVPDEQREALKMGLLYDERNETRGRLPGSEYGTTYVKRAFVEKAVSESFDGGLLKYAPSALNGVQDVYVVQRGVA